MVLNTISKARNFRHCRLSIFIWTVFKDGEIIDLGPGLQCLLKFKADLKLRTESLAYENGHVEITEIKTISCIL